MGNSQKKKLTPEERSLEIRKLQAHLLSDCYPPGMDRKSTVKNLMQLKNTREKKKKEDCGE